VYNDLFSAFLVFRITIERDIARDIKAHDVVAEFASNGKSSAVLLGVEQLICSRGLLYWFWQDCIGLLFVSFYWYNTHIGA